MFLAVFCLMSLQVQVQDLWQTRTKYFGGKTLFTKIIKMLVTAFLEAQVTLKFPNMNQ